MQHELEEVFAWLEARDEADYQAGVLLLQKHCKNRSMVNGLLRKESPTNREKLVYELVKVGCGGRMQDVSEVLNHFAQAVQGAVAMVQQVADVLTGQEFPEQPEPEHVRSAMDALTELMNRVYQQRCQLSNSLATLDPAEGPRVVKEILGLEQQYNALAQKRRNMVAGELGIATDQTEAFGQAVDQAVVALGNESAAPEATESAAPGIDRAELVKQRNTLRSNISKAKKKAETSQTEEKKSEYSQKVAKLQVELDLIEMQLKA